MKTNKVNLILCVALVIFILIDIASTILLSDAISISKAKSEKCLMSITEDVIFSCSMYDVLNEVSSPFAGVCNLTSIDLLLINFENPAIDSDNAVNGDFPLAKENDNTITFPDNHAFDHGVEGMRNKLKNLKNAGMALIGTGEYKSVHNAVTHGIGVYNCKSIFYSLENFIFDQSNTAEHDTCFVQTDIVNDAGECSVYPVLISGYLPQYMGSDCVSSFLNGLAFNTDNFDVSSGVGKLKFNLTDGDLN